MLERVSQQAQTIRERGPTLAHGLLQHKCACGQHTVAGGECAECRKNREVGILRRATLQSSAFSPHSSAVPPIVHEVLCSPGQPLDPTARAFMEPHFGHDFSRVRTHTDTKAAESAQVVKGRLRP